MSAPSDRRSFLRGLVSLPLIGGGVALIGSPNAVAEPATLPLLERYCDWLAVEYGEALIELSGLRNGKWNAHYEHYRREWCQDNATLNPKRDPRRFAFELVPRPSTRAALVLATVGCDCREGSR